jgi:hypothetical protein
MGGAGTDGSTISQVEITVPKQNTPGREPGGVSQ